MGEPDLKEMGRLFYIVKGHLNTTEETLRSSYNGYFKRMWIDGSNGAPLYDYEKGFEEAWIEYQNNVSHKEKK